MAAINFSTKASQELSLLLVLPALWVSQTACFHLFILNSLDIFNPLKKVYSLNIQKIKDKHYVCGRCVCACIKRLGERDYTLHRQPCCPAITLRPMCGTGRWKPLKISPNAVGETLCYLALVRRDICSRGSEHSTLLWSTKQSADAGHLCKESTNGPRWEDSFPHFRETLTNAYNNWRRISESHLFPISTFAAVGNGKTLV